MIDFLIIFLKPAIKCSDNPRKYWYLLPLAVFAWIFDIVIAHTTWAIIAGWPKSNEFSISNTLERLCNPSNSDHEDYALFCQIGYKINRATNSNHIKILTL